MICVREGVHYVTVFDKGEEMAGYVYVYTAVICNKTYVNVIFFINNFAICSIINLLKLTISRICETAIYSTI